MTAIMCGIVSLGSRRRKATSALRAKTSIGSHAPNKVTGDTTLSHFFPLGDIT